ncbi:MAG: tRNA 2-thiouridine(34) synthase MnmA [Anaerovoracaceae bacterium]|jgi:tRNA-specific 2-thiouridylase|nr:tRNA 2-thiouridine(34) synthase MnmA [Anaerovoracaceae bacterium]
MKNRAMNSLDSNKVILGLSGGVDSTAAALLLKEKGLEVIGLFLDMTGKSNVEMKSAQQAAKELQIPFVYRDASKEFSDKVVENFTQEYSCGRTPNPCVICNPLVKFQLLLDVADQMNAAFIATGHYARTYFDEDLSAWFIRRGANKKKDQSYTLYRLPQKVISRLIMPLGDISHKDDVRALVREKDLSNAGLRDSQEICFIGKGDNYISFLESKGIKSQPGNFIDEEGNILGPHKGIIYYTIGQKKGLGGSFGRPMYVNRINTEDNTIVLSKDEQDLFKYRVVSKDNIFNIPFEGLRVDAKLRYAAKPAPAFIRPIEDNKIEAIFDEPQRAPTPGQSIVFYLGDFVLGGGIIEG